MAFEELKVPGEEGVWNCARHKGVQTRLRCGRCEKPICPKCTVMAPTGARCRECVSNRDAHMYQVGPKHLGLAFSAAVGVGVLGAFLTSIAGAFWLWILLYAPAVGPLLGRLITRITGGKRGPKVALVVSLGLICGALGCALAAAWFSYGNSLQGFDPELADLPPEVAAQMRQGLQKVPLTLPLLLALTLGNFPLWIFIFIAVGGVWWWLK